MNLRPNLRNGPRFVAGHLRLLSLWLRTRDRAGFLLRPPLRNWANFGTLNRRRASFRSGLLLDRSAGFGYYRTLNVIGPGNPVIGPLNLILHLTLRHWLAGRFWPLLHDRGSNAWLFREGRARGRCSIRSGKRAWCDKNRRAALVHAGKLSPIESGRLNMLNLGRHRAHPPLTEDGQFRSDRPGVNSTATTVITNPIGGEIIDYRPVVDIADNGYIHVRDSAVVGE